jgi:hypothetical protein
MTTWRTKEPVPAPSEAEQRRRIAEIRELAADGHCEPALLLAWGTMEGVARAAEADTFPMRLTAGQFLETLAMEGFVTPSEADRVRALLPKRDGIMHGDLDVRVSKSEIDDFVQIIERLRELVPA